MLLISMFLLLLSNGLTVRKDVSILYSRIAIFILMYCIISSYISFYVTYMEKGLGLYNGLFIASSVTHTFQLFIFIASSIILLLTGFYPRKIYGDNPEKKNINNLISLVINKMAEQYTIIEYALIILFVVIGGTLLLSSGDFISIFLCIELQSYGLYILSTIYRDSESATSSGLTYFLLGGLSSCFILLGIVFIYVNTGVTSLDSFYVLTNLTTSPEFLSPWYKSEYITYSLLIISVGLLFKIAAAPFHFWSPDVYDGIPTIVTTFVANMAKISILVLMLDLVHYTSETFIKTTSDWTTGILISSLLSLIIGTVLGLTQSRIKRLFAYSTISHVGFILLALGVNTIESSKAFMFYLMQYTITNINGFIILISIGFSLYLYANNNLVFTKLKDKNNSPIQLISQIKGYFYINPILALSLSVVMLSFAGIPPFVGFFAKLMVFSSALDNGFVFLVLIAVITSVIGAVYYLGIIKTMFFDKNEYEKYNLELNVTLSSSLSVPVSGLTALIVLFILTPNEIINLSDIVSIISYASGLNLDEGNKIQLIVGIDTSFYKDLLNGIDYVKGSFSNIGDTITSKCNLNFPKSTMAYDGQIESINKQIKHLDPKTRSMLPNLPDNFPSWLTGKAKNVFEEIPGITHNIPDHLRNIIVHPVLATSENLETMINEDNLNGVLMHVRSFAAIQDVQAVVNVIKLLLEKGHYDTLAYVIKELGSDAHQVSVGLGGGERPRVTLQEFGIEIFHILFSMNTLESFRAFFSHILSSGPASTAMWVIETMVYFMPYHIFKGTNEMEMIISEVFNHISTLNAETTRQLSQLVHAYIEICDADFDSFYNENPDLSEEYSAIDLLQHFLSETPAITADLHESIVAFLNTVRETAILQPFIETIGDVNGLDFHVDNYTGFINLSVVQQWFIHEPLAEYMAGWNSEHEFGRLDLDLIYSDIFNDDQDLPEVIEILDQILKMIKRL